jgi:hypothetical protein
MGKNNTLFGIASITIGLLVLLVAIARGTGYWKSSFDRNQEKPNIAVASISLVLAEKKANEPERGYEINTLPSGNQSFLVLEFDSPTRVIKWEILKALRYFEKKNPTLKILNWFVDKETSGHIYGLWITHESK